MIPSIFFKFASAAAALAALASAATAATISNVLPRRSTDGAIMDAHSGPIQRWLEPDGSHAYYWFASSYGDCAEPPQNESGCTPWPPPPDGCGFRDDHVVTLFVSRDLAAWENRGAVMRMADLPHGGPDGLPPGSIMYSPIVVFDKASARYLLWFNYVLPDFSGSFVAIAASAAREGPFTLVVRNVTTLAHAAVGDFDILLDDDGASAFMIYTSHIFGPGPAHLMSVERLAPGFMASTGENSGFFGDAGVEAPTLWRRGDTYHASFGGTCCFCAEGSDAIGYTAPAPLGPWTRRGVIGGGASTGRIRAQQSAVFPWVDAATNETQFMWWGDRWQSAPDQNKAHDASFFFPLSFLDDGSVAEMTWLDSFEVEAADTALAPRLAAAAAAGAAGRAPLSLRTLALLDTENDEDQVAAVAEVNETSGRVRTVSGNFSWSVQWSTSLDCATTFAPEVGARGTWLSLVGQGPSVAAVDAASGKLLHLSPAISVAYVVASVSWDAARGDLAAIGSASGATGLDLIRINATTGAVTVELRGLKGAKFPQPCESVISLATRTFFTVADDTGMDDADQAVEAYDLDSGALRHAVSWPAKSAKAGPLGGPVVVRPAAAGGADTLVLLWRDGDMARPLRYVTLDFATGNVTVLCELPARFADTVVDIGGVSPVPVTAAADGSFALAAIAFDNSQDEGYLLRLNVRAGGAKAGNGNTTLTKLIEGGKVLWAPVFV